LGIEIEPTHVVGGQRYRVTHAGEVLSESTWNPEFEACRALLERGITGKLQVWRPGKAYWGMQLDIERGAGLTVRETEEEGPYIARWRPYAGVRPPDALLYPRGSAAGGHSRPGSPVPSRNGRPQI
jgi:hypothetical protein